MYRDLEPLDRFAQDRQDGLAYVELCYLDDLKIEEVRRALEACEATLIANLR